LRVAALYDVHGNVHALEAVLAEVDADLVVFGGDIVAGAFPIETLELVRSVPNARFVRGNGDELDRAATVAEWDAERRWLIDQLDGRSRRWLAELPFSFSCDDALYVHANPLDVTGMVIETTPDEEIASLVAPIGEQRVVTGHVHMQFARNVSGVEWIGAGSVGSAYEDVPGAYWATIDGGEVEFRRTEYDREAYERAVRAGDHPLRDDLLVPATRAEAIAAFST
jgi:predicted phosphodiesterase